jgi:hypothetical protein
VAGRVEVAEYSWFEGRTDVGRCQVPADNHDADAQQLARESMVASGGTRGLEAALNGFVGSKTKSGAVFIGVHHLLSSNLPCYYIPWR